MPSADGDTIAAESGTSRRIDVLDSQRAYLDTSVWPRITVGVVADMPKLKPVIVRSPDPRAAMLPARQLRTGASYNMAAVKVPPASAPSLTVDETH